MNFKINLSQCCGKNKSANCKGKENKFFSYLNSFKARSWTQFQAQLRKGPPIFDKDSLVNHTIPMKRQTPAFDTLKTV